MPDVEKIMEPWAAGERQAKRMPDFENGDLLSVIDEVCGNNLLYKLHSAAVSGKCPPKMSTVKMPEIQTSDKENCSGDDIEFRR